MIQRAHLLQVSRKLGATCSKGKREVARAHEGVSAAQILVVQCALSKGLYHEGPAGGELPVDLQCIVGGILHYQQRLG